MAHQLLSLTPAAIERVRHLMATLGEGAAGIRVGVKSAGCSGLTYTIDFAREIGPSDEVVEVDGVKVVIDPKAIDVPARHRDRLRRGPARRRVQVPQSERGRALRLRRIVHGLSADAGLRRAAMPRITFITAAGRTPGDRGAERPLGHGDRAHARPRHRGGVRGLDRLRDLPCHRRCRLCRSPGRSERGRGGHAGPRRSACSRPRAWAARSCSPTISTA